MLSYSLAKIIVLAVDILRTLIIVRIIMSWLSHNRFNPLIIQLYKITDPILKPFQNIFPPVGGIDFSPMVAIFALQIAQRVLIQIIFAVF